MDFEPSWGWWLVVAPNISWLFMMTPISQNLTRACCLLPLPAWIRNGDAVGKHQQLIISRVQFLFRSILLIIKIVSSTFKDVRRGVGKILGNLMPQKWSGFVRGSAARSLHNTPGIIWRDCHRGAARKETTTVTKLLQQLQCLNRRRGGVSVVSTAAGHRRFSEWNVCLLAAGGGCIRCW